MMLAGIIIFIKFVPRELLRDALITKHFPIVGLGQLGFVCKSFQPQKRIKRDESQSLRNAQLTSTPTINKYLST